MLYNTYFPSKNGIISETSASLLKILTFGLIAGMMGDKSKEVNSPTDEEIIIESNKMAHEIEGRITWSFLGSISLLRKFVSPEDFAKLEKIV